MVNAVFENICAQIPVRRRQPDIFNTDQGSQTTSRGFTGTPTELGFCITEFELRQSCAIRDERYRFRG